MKKKILIVGAGFAGSVIARKIADAGFTVVIIDSRNHIGGNAYDFLDENGINTHKYGPHLFHTNNKKVVDFLSRFTDWIPYKHKVKAVLSDGNLVTLPINQETTKIVGEQNLIDTFIRPYSEKMWAMKLEEIDPKVIQRVPIRSDLNELYFPDDKYQMLPFHGYTKLFENMLNHPNITLLLSRNFEKQMEEQYDHIFNSMPIDEYNNFIYGELPYRSIKFHSVTIPIPRVFPVAQINFTHHEKYTRITEWKNIPNSNIPNPNYTKLTYEEPCDYHDNNNQRFYPVKDVKGLNKNIYLKYVKMTPSNVTFVGRLGMYAYLDMHQVISSSLSIADLYISENQ
jgi:UDP-galactopyranose mutase